MLGGVLAALALLVALLATATTPEQARAQRAIPELPPPTMAVAEGSRPGVVAVPEGALVTDEDGRTLVTVWQEHAARKVQVREVRSDLPKLIEVRGVGLQVGDMVELVVSDDAQAPPRMVR